MSKLSCLLAISAIVLLSVESNGESSIIGGKNAVNGQFPHHVQIRHVAQNRPYCGGSIIGPRHVLATAECVTGRAYKVEEIKIIVGQVDIRTTATEHEVDKLISHPEANGYHNNIGVIRVVQPFQFTANVQPIKLPTTDTPITSDGSEVPALFAGWGEHKANPSNPTFPNILQWMKTTAISRPECLRAFRGTGIEHYIAPNTICARNTADVGTCGLDGGGGLITEGTPQQRVIIGVSSFTMTPCAQKRWPNVFARVFPHLEFIKQAMRA